jgi:spermidine synthase
MRSPRAGFLLTAVLCLLVSGMAGLIYQVVWTRYLTLLLGHTSHAVVAVLVAFMGGLALGNAWIGRRADHLKRPLAWYAFLELGIALFGLLFPGYFAACEALYDAIARGMEPGSPWLTGLKLMTSVAVILLPATLMGGTLPVLTRMVTQHLGELRSRVAGLYFINSLGAVIGVWVGDFWWIPSLGLEVTVWGAAVLNLAVGVAALGMERRLAREGGLVGGTGETGTEPKAPGEEYAPFEWRLAVIAAGASGFVAMLYEVVWTRLLALALGSSTHAFSIMLITFISGIAVGAWIVARWKGLRRTFDAFGWAELALAVALGASMFGYHRLPWVFAQLSGWVARAPENHWLYQLLQGGVCFMVMFGPAVLLGMTLPLASRVATARVAETGRRVGLVFSVNTVGTVLGAGLTGLALMPWLGLARTMALGVAMNAGIALLVLLRRGRVWQGWLWAAAVALMAVWVGVAGAVLSPQWDRAFALGLWRDRGEAPSWEQFEERVRRFDLRSHRDGASATVVVEGWQSNRPGPLDVSLRVNGKTDASSRADLPTQLLSGHLPMLKHSAAQDVLVVGVGSGITVGAVLTHPGVRHVDVVEISPEVVDAARLWFGPHNGRALEDSRTRVVVDDAKSFLRNTDQTYDVIVTEPSNPWMAGVSGVFSLEYYQSCRARLRPGGVVAQWVQLYETSDAAVEMVMATFGSVFPFFSIWETLPGDLLLVGMVDAVPWDLAGLERRFQDPNVTRDLRRADLFSVPVLLGLQRVSEPNAAFVAPLETERHSDYHPRLEYIAERAFFAQRGTQLIKDVDESSLRRSTLLLAEYLRNRPLQVVDAEAFAVLHATYRVPLPRLMRSVAERWQELEPGSLIAGEYWSRMRTPPPLAELHVRRGARLLPEMIQAASQEPSPLRQHADQVMAWYRDLRSVIYQPPVEDLNAVLERLESADPTHRELHRLRRAEVAWDLGQDEDFWRIAEAAFASPTPDLAQRFDTDPTVSSVILHRAMETRWRQGRMEEALAWGERARARGLLETRHPGYYRPLAVTMRKVDASAAPR